MQLARLRVRTIAPVALALSCACGRTSDAVSQDPANHEGSIFPPGWVVFAENDTAVWAFDTTTMTGNANQATLWVSVVDHRPANRGVPVSPFRRFDSLQEILCVPRVARSFRIRTPDSAGVVSEHAVRDSSWILFSDHGFSAPVLDEACRKLKGLP